MAYRRIVVATDGSDSAETAETIASTLASIDGAKLTIAHAYANPDRANEAVARAKGSPTARGPFTSSHCPPRRRRTPSS